MLRSLFVLEVTCPNFWWCRIQWTCQWRPCLETRTPPGTFVTPWPATGAIGQGASRGVLIGRCIRLGGRSVFFVFRECFVRFLRYVPGTGVKGCFKVFQQNPQKLSWWESTLVSVGLLDTRVSTSPHTYCGFSYSSMKELDHFYSPGFRQIWKSRQT